MLSGGPGVHPAVAALVFGLQAQFPTRLSKHPQGNPARMYSSSFSPRPLALEFFMRTRCGAAVFASLGPRARPPFCAPRGPLGGRGGRGERMCYLTASVEIVEVFGPLSRPCRGALAGASCERKDRCRSGKNRSASLTYAGLLGFCFPVPRSFCGVFCGWDVNLLDPSGFAGRSGKARKSGGLFLSCCRDPTKMAYHGKRSNDRNSGEECLRFQSLADGLTPP